MKSLLLSAIVVALSALTVSGCSKSEGHSVEGAETEQRLIVATSPAVKDVTTTEQYVCQIHSCRHIEVRALETGYLEAIKIKEGQAVKQGDLLFKIVPTLYQARLDAEIAEVQLAQIELNNTKQLFAQRVVSDKEVALAQAKLAKTQAQVALAQAELNFTDVKAPFDGIIDRLHEQQGSLIEDGDMLTSLSDNSTMWVYFNVPEARYLAYREGLNQVQSDDDDDREEEHGDDDDDDDEYEEEGDLDHDDVAEHRGGTDMQIELVLANGMTFNQHGKIGAIEADFNNETGNIAFRADFPNPESLLRFGQTGSILIHRVVHDAIVIPQRATFEILDKRYVFILGEDNVVHQQEIKVQHELEDIYVIEDGVKAGDKLILEGVRQVRDGEKVEFEFRDAKLALSDMKYKAE